MDLHRRRECLATGGLRVGLTGVRRILDNAADRALAAGPPSHRQELTYTAMWAATTVTAWVLLRVARALSR